MNIRQADETMLEDLLPLFEAYLVFYKQESDTERARQFLEERMRNRESVIFIAYNEKGKAMGFTQLYPCFSSVSMSRIYILNDLFVGPEYRRLGVAAALMARAEAFGKERGAVRLHLETAEDNLKAQNLYERENWLRDSGFYHYVKLLR